MVNISIDIRQPTCWYHNYDTSQLLIFGGHVKERESLCAHVISLVNAILNQVDSMTIYLRMKVTAWYIDLNSIKNNNTIKYPYHIDTKKYETYIIDAK